MSDLFDLNRAHWDEVTAIHVASPFYATKAFRAGEVILDPIARESVGDVAGKRLLHLQCHFGLDTLSLARLGATVTGLDFSGAALDAARKLADETSTQATFVQANALQPPPGLTGFDLVFASWGAICWIPDMAAWMRTAAGALKPGGRLVLIEGHPMMLTLSSNPAKPYAVEVAYDRAEPYMIEGVGDYAERDVTLTADTTAEWMHGAGSVLNAAISAGFRIRSFDELDRVPWQALPQLERVDDHYFALPAGAPSFPLAFRLIADRL